MSACQAGLWNDREKGLDLCRRMIEVQQEQQRHDQQLLEQQRLL